MLIILNFLKIVTNNINMELLINENNLVNTNENELLENFQNAFYFFPTNRTISFNVH